MFIRRRLKLDIADAVKATFGPDAPEPVIGFPREAAHGDYATNFPLKAAKALGRAPMEIAGDLERALAGRSIFSAVTKAKPGFVNLFLAPAFIEERLEKIAGGADVFSHYRETPKKINVEFVSANPTGPLTVGHGRNACLGDSLARLLKAVGHDVTREYYFNNAGRQMKILGESLRARFLEEAGKPSEFPEEGYVGEYIREIARDVLRERGPGIDPADLDLFRRAAEKSIFDMIRKTLDRLGVAFDVYFNEDQLYKNGEVTAVLKELETRGLTQPEDGAILFRGEAQGLPKNPVLVKKTGEPTYRLPDVAYHIDKLRRKFDLIIDVLGADHIDEHREVLAILKSLGHPTAAIRGIIYQFVTLVRDGKPVKMSTRKAEYVTLDDLLEEVGPDVARFFFLSRKSDTHLEFDLALAKAESNENPVYYVQYAHARLAGIFRTAAEQGFSMDGVRTSRVDLSNPSALTLAKKILSLGDVLESELAELEVGGILWYIRELAEAFHVYYTDVRVVESADREGTLGRLKLCLIVQTIISSVLTTLGIRAPERM